MTRAHLTAAIALSLILTGSGAFAETNETQAQHEPGAANAVKLETKLEPETDLVSGQTAPDVSEAEERAAAEWREEADRRSAEQSTNFGGKRARCVVDSGSERYEGPCLFRSSEGGSFLIRRPDGGLFYGEVTEISVILTGRGRAQVSGLTRGGINTRQGPVIRSNVDKACWVNEDIDFSVCAYG